MTIVDLLLQCLSPVWGSHLLTARYFSVATVLAGDVVVVGGLGRGADHISVDRPPSQFRN